MLVSSACSQALDSVQRDLFLNGIVVRLVVTDSLASAAGRDTAGQIGSGLDGSSPRGDG
jgi:hypothetical protein